MIFNFVLNFAALHMVITSKAVLSEQNIGRHSANTKQLLRLVDVLNSQQEKRIETLNDRDFMKNLENRGQLNQYKKEVSDKISQNLQNILRVVQKNYDAFEKNKEVKPDPVILISNPEVLEEYNNGHHVKEETFINQLRRQIEQSPILSTSSSSSEESDDKRRNLKNVLQDIRKNSMLPSSDDIKELLSAKRRSQKDLSDLDIGKDESVEKSWKEDTMKEKPQKKKDFSEASDTNQQASGHKKDYRPRKRPVGFQSNSKIKFDSYKPKKDSYFQKREDYRSYGRTSIPVVGKKSVYEKK